jgi:hypothetical protein
VPDERDAIVGGCRQVDDQHVDDEELHQPRERACRVVRGDEGTLASQQLRQVRQRLPVVARDGDVDAA